MSEAQLNRERYGKCLSRRVDMDNCDRRPMTDPKEPQSWWEFRREAKRLEARIKHLETERKVAKVRGNHKAAMAYEAEIAELKERFERLREAHARRE